MAVGPPLPRREVVTSLVRGESVQILVIAFSLRGADRAALSIALHNEL